MANSRSNIYPVKLQGAELNLNKFDAEIKQYSGFNKNNSPFVGGCLSNLFTKTEENTTGSSDSVYVDDNGDIFTAELDGLYKNGEKVINFSLISPEISDRPWTLKKLEGGDKVDFYDVLLGEQLPRTLEGFITARFTATPGASALGVIYVHFEKNTLNIDRSFNVYDSTAPYGDIVVVDNVFYDWQYKRNNDVFFVAKMCYRNLTTNKYYIKIYFRTINGHYTVENQEFTKELTEEVYFRYAPPVFYMRGSNGVICPNILDNTYNSFLSFDLDSSSYPIHEDEVTFDNYEPETFTLWSNLKSGGVFFRKTSHYVISMYILQASHTFSDTTAKKLLLAGHVDIHAGFAGVQSAFLETQYLKYPANTTISVSYGSYNGQYVLRNFGVSYALKTNDNKNFWGISGYLTNSVTLRKDDNDALHPMLEMGAITSCVLINNGYVSGICLPKGNILVTDWNSVDVNSINMTAEFNNRKERALYCTFKDLKGDYYLLSNTEAIKPSIREINGYLVVNVDELNNCYRLSDGKIMTFAPAWNNRASQSNLITFDAAVTDNQYYLASSVNEYDLRDNASILLNPIPVITDALQVVQNNDYTFTIKDIKNLFSDNKDFRINFYSGSLSSSEFLYKGSSNYETTAFVYNSSLDGLHFPINTNGNVQLSPSLFCKTEMLGNDVFIKEGSNAYQLIKDGAESVMSYYLGTLIENLEDIFILQGQYYAIINKQIFNVQFSGGVVQSLSFVVSVENLQFCGNSAYQAYFFSKTNRCIYVFTGANILSQLQLVDKISEIYAYKYNQSTQSIILITDIGTIVSSNLGMYLIEGFTPDDVFFYDKGVVFVSDSELTYLQYYEADGFEKHNIEVETCFYGMNNETVTINDCLYFRLFSEEHEEGEVKVSATTISLKGRKTETTVFKFKASDWDALTHSVYVRYQPKEQRGLGISFSIDSPFKIASLSVGSKADAILVDKVSKGAVITPSNNDEW